MQYLAIIVLFLDTIFVWRLSFVRAQLQRLCGSRAFFIAPRIWTPAQEVETFAVLLSTAKLLPSQEREPSPIHPCPFCAPWVEADALRTCLFFWPPRPPAGCTRQYASSGRNSQFRTVTFWRNGTPIGRIVTYKDSVMPC